MSRLVTMKETLLYHYVLDTKQKSIARVIASHHVKNFRVQKFAGKVLASNFWVQDGNFLIN
jgi:hypothetical protein